MVEEGVAFLGRTVYVASNRLNICDPSRALLQFCNTDFFNALIAGNPKAGPESRQTFIVFRSAFCLKFPAKFTAYPLDVMRGGVVSLSFLSAPIGQYTRASFEATIFVEQQSGQAKLARKQ